MTLVGDAIHNMPPTGGEGANMALKDAATLCAALTAAEPSSLTDALADYQSQMLSYAFDAVTTSMTNLDRMVKRGKEQTSSYRPNGSGLSASRS